MNLKGGKFLINQFLTALLRSGLLGLLMVWFFISATHVNAELIHDIDFENGYEGLGKDLDGASDSAITISTDCNRGNEQCAIANRPNGASRVELSAGRTSITDGRAPLEQVVWYGWSIRVDRNDRTDNHIIVSQIHHHQGSNVANQWSNTANFVVRHDGPTQTLSLRHGFQTNHPNKIRDDNLIDLGEGNFGEWYDFIVQVRWTYQNNGFLKFWKNGQLIYDYSGPTYFDYGPDTVGPYWKAGAYLGTTPAQVYIDNYRRGDANSSFAEVDPSSSDTPTSGPCSLYKSGNSAPSPYGLSWDWTTTQRDLLLKVTCESGGTRTVNIGNGRETGSGSNFAGLTYVYHQGYWTDGNAGWQQYNLSCSGNDTTKIVNSWCKGSAKASLPSQAKWFVGYSCIWSGSQWQCGCTNSSCTGSYWQIQGISGNGSGGDSGNGGTSTATNHGFASCGSSPARSLPPFDFGNLGYRNGATIPAGTRTATRTFGEGRHTITSVLNLSSNQVLRGAGRDKTTLYFPNGLKGMGHSCSGGTNDCYDWTGGPGGEPAGVIHGTGSEVGIEGVTIEFPSHTWAHHDDANNGGYNGIELDSCTNCWIKDVAVKNADNGVHISGGSNITVEDLDVRTVSGGGHLHAAISRGHSIVFNGFRMYGGSTHGIGGNFGSGEWVYANGWGERLKFEADHNGPATTNALYSNISGTIRAIQTTNRAGDLVDQTLWNVENVDRCPLDVYSEQR